MMKRHLGVRAAFLLLCLSALGSTACGQSPLFNHEGAQTAAQQGAQQPRENIQQGECPLSFVRAGLCGQLTWTKQPGENETGSFELDFWDATHGAKQGPYVDPAQTLAVKLWMPAMGHGSSPVTIARRKDASTGAELPGQFDVSNVYFVMPGEWEIHVQLKNGSSVFEEVVLPVQI